MPFVDDPNDNQENTGVAGAAPLSQGTPSQPMQDSENMSQQAASGPTAGSEAPAQQATTNKSAKNHLLECLIIFKNMLIRIVHKLKRWQEL